MHLKLNKIHNTALYLFKTKGIESTTTYDIALESKIPYSIIDEKYPSIKDLILEIFSIGQDNLFGFVYGDLAELDDFKKMMRIIFHQSVDWGVNNADLFCFMDIISKPYKWETESNKIYPKVNEIIMNRVEIEINKGNVKNLPIDFVAHILTKMLSACVSYIIALKTEDKKDYSNIVDMMYETCWDALKK